MTHAVHAHFARLLIGGRSAPADFNAVPYHSGTVAYGALIPARTDKGAGEKSLNVAGGVVGATGIEPVTPSVSGKCSTAELYARRRERPGSSLRDPVRQGALLM
jgi:hypothetical protein